MKFYNSSVISYHSEVKSFETLSTFYHLSKYAYWAPFASY